jgi:hypothetical protein
MYAVSIHMKDTLSLDPGIIETNNKPALTFWLAVFDFVVQIGDMWFSKNTPNHVCACVSAYGKANKTWRPVTEWKSPSHNQKSAQSVQ